MLFSFIYLFLEFFSLSLIPENIHTPTMEGIGNARGVGGQKPKKFQRGGGGGLTVILTSRRLVQFNAALVVRRLLLTSFGGTF